MAKSKNLREATQNLRVAMADFSDVFVESMTAIFKQAEEWRKQGWLDKNYKPTEKLKKALAKGERKNGKSFHIHRKAI